MPNAKLKLLDQPHSFGWISIVLHWLSAVLLVTLWFLGQSISSLSDAEAFDRRNLHVTAALCTWVLLFFRLVWRIKFSHPQAFGQTQMTHFLAKYTHYIMLLFILAMLVSGPFMLWASARPAWLFGVVPIPVSDVYMIGMAGVASAVHRVSASILLLLTLLHITSFFKHLMFHDDETIARIFWPK